MNYGASFRSTVIVMVEHLLKYSKLSLALWLVVMQLFAPLAHAHLGESASDDGIHIHIDSHNRIQQERDDQELTFSPLDYPDAMVVEVSTGLKKKLRLGEFPPCLTISHETSFNQSPIVRHSLAEQPSTFTSSYFVLPPGRAPPLI